MDFSKTLIDWYAVNKRNLPWRETRDPYVIWLSEIILQQTRVEQGKPYFYSFYGAFPTIQDLARANEDEILKLWQGLGYYSRARNLHTTARHITCELNGVFPRSYQELLKLKGIGEYTAAAIASFSYHQAYPVVDGNVYRVLARYLGISVPMDTAKGKQLFVETASQLLDKNNPATYNQAIMEFGALQCTPGQPDCGPCPLLKTCAAFATGKVTTLPVKLKKTRQKNRYLHYFYIKLNNQVLINKRTDKDIWQNLYDFPSIETPGPCSEKKLLESTQWKRLFGETSPDVIRVSEEYLHVLSHQKIHARFWILRLNKKNTGFFARYELIHHNEIIRFAVPKLIENFLQNENL